ncbi:hypothetical protein [Yinghuangia soli]|uniref:Uncharacterized protein n=1 Tax=Yinghuangia soli TaxID=2908204 RepID=A0AA41Q2H4_9ACTN|nr:hypothetical protein [Yinghuangia soli]MCF2528897.1 hypothetical protein [Yinghuangia soli]
MTSPALIQGGGPSALPVTRRGVPRRIRALAANGPLFTAAGSCSSCWSWPRCSPR